MGKLAHGVHDIPSAVGPRNLSMTTDMTEGGSAEDSLYSPSTRPRFALAGHYPFMVPPPSEAGEMTPARKKPATDNTPGA